jgi:hypothetical protein
MADSLFDELLEPLAVAAVAETVATAEGVLGAIAEAALAVFSWVFYERQYRGEDGRFVGRDEVRQVLDGYLDDVSEDIRRDTRSLVAGTMAVSEWQLRTEAAIKRSHVAAGALAAGGRKQATASDWLAIARKVKFQYGKLREFAREIENGTHVLNGATVARAAMYGVAATSAYEYILRRGDIAAGFDRERRILHSEAPCKRCRRHAAKGWQPAGVLPNIGEDCDCLSNCRCTFERKRSVPRRRPFMAANFGFDDFLDDVFASFARGGGGAKGTGKGKAGKAKGAGGKAKGAGGPCGANAPGGGGFQKGNTCGSAGAAASAKKAGEKRAAGRLVARSKAAALKGAEAKAKAGVAAAGGGIKGMVARSKAASVANAKAVADKAAAADAKRQARNAKAREKRAAKKAAAKEARAPAINRMVARSKGAAEKGAAKAKADRGPRKAEGRGTSERQALASSLRDSKNAARGVRADTLDRWTRFYGDMSRAKYASSSGADKIDAARDGMVVVALRRIRQGMPVKKAVEMYRAEWGAFSKEQNAKVNSAPKIKRGPSSGQSVIGYKVATASNGEQGELNIYQAVRSAKEAAKGRTNEPRLPLRQQADAAKARKIERLPVGGLWAGREDLRTSQKINPTVARAEQLQSLIDSRIRVATRERDKAAVNRLKKAKNKAYAIGDKAKVAADKQRLRDQKKATPKADRQGRLKVAAARAETKASDLRIKANGLSASYDKARIAAEKAEYKRQANAPKLRAKADDLLSRYSKASTVASAAGERAYNLKLAAANVTTEAGLRRANSGRGPKAAEATAAKVSKAIERTRPRESREERVRNVLSRAGDVIGDAKDSRGRLQSKALRRDSQGRLKPGAAEERRAAAARLKRARKVVQALDPKEQARLMASRERASRRNARQLRLNFAESPKYRLHHANFAASPDADHVSYKGLIFRAGEYKGQRFAMTPAELAAYVKVFEPVPIDVGHPQAESPLDGAFGRLASVELSPDGTALFGRIELPKWLDEKLGKAARKVSSSWDRSTKRMRRLSLVTNPQIKDAELVAAFALAHPESDAFTLTRSPVVMPMTNRDLLKAQFNRWLDSPAATADFDDSPALAPATAGLEEDEDFDDMEDDEEDFEDDDEDLDDLDDEEDEDFDDEEDDWDDEEDGDYEDDDELDEDDPTMRIQDTPEFKAAVKAEVSKATRAADEANFATQAETWFDAELKAGRVKPKEREKLIARHIHLAGVDRDNPAEFGDGEPLSLLAEFCGDIKARAPHGLSGENVGNADLSAGQRALPNGTQPPPETTMSPEKMAKLLSATPEGKAALASAAAKVK